MVWPELVGFGLGVLPLVVTPGASFALATQRAGTGERWAVCHVIAGTATGIYVHALLAGLGLSAVVLRSSQAFELVKLAGAAYLVGLGVLMLCRARRSAPSAPGSSGGPGGARRLPWSGHHAYPQALLANVLNPKAASVYLTLAPQFLSADRIGPAPLVALASVHVIVMAAWLALWAGVLRRIRGVLDSARARAVIARLGGAVLIALGLREAAASA